MAVGAPYTRIPDAKRTWRGHWLCCLGPECSPEDGAGCCLAWSIPGVAYSWNVSKVLHLPFWRELVKYVCVLGLLTFVWSQLGVARMLTSCYPVRDDDPNNPMHLKPNDRATCQTLELVSYYAVLLFMLGGLIWALFIGGRNRTRMRLQLGIPVSSQGFCCRCCHNNSTYCNDDCCLHFWCMACALAQETRTILHEEAVGSIQPRLLNGGYMPVEEGLALTPPAVVEADASIIIQQSGGPTRDHCQQRQLPV